MRRLQPALLGGLFIGVLSSLPLVQYGNACCCLWVVLGGVVTVYLQRQRPPASNTNDVFEAVLGGVIAGLVGGLVQMVLSTLLVGSPSAAEMQEALERLPQLPPEVRDRILEIMARRGPMFLALISAFVTLPLYAVFSMVGALLGLAIFKKRSPPAPDDVRVVDDVSNRPPQ